MKILVTGAAGFIGSHLCEELEGQAHQVTKVDPKIDGERLQNITLINPYSYDLIYLAGSVVGVEDVLNQPYFNVINELGMVQAGLKFPNARIVYLSSSDVYGVHGDVVSKETDALAIGPTERPRWSYAAAKLAGEHLVHWSDNESVVCRLFNIAGPRQRPEAGVIAKWCQMAVNGETLPVYPNQRRTFLHVKDLVDALVLLGTMENPPSLCNVGENLSWEMEDIAQVIISHSRNLFDCDFSWEHVDMSNRDDPPSKMPDLTRILVTGWKPTRTLGGIIRDTLEFWRAKKYPGR